MKSINPIVANAIKAKNEIGDYGFDTKSVYSAAKKLISAGAKHVRGYLWEIPEDMVHGADVIVRKAGGKVKVVGDASRDGFVIAEVTDPLAQALERRGVIKNATIEKTIPPRGAKVYIEQQGAKSYAIGPIDDKWSYDNYGGSGVNFAHGFSSVSAAKSWCASKGYKVDDVILANAVARNTTMTNTKALNAIVAFNSIRGNTKLKNIDYWFADNGYGDDTLIKYVQSYKKNKCIDFVDRHADTAARDAFYDAMYELTGVKSRWALNSRACNSTR